MTYLVRRIRADDWRELRRLRLEALKDSPLAFVEQYDEAAVLSDQRWQERARGAATGRERATFVATVGQASDGGPAEDAALAEGAAPAADAGLAEGAALAADAGLAEGARRVDDGGPAERLVGMAGVFSEAEILDHVSAMLVGVYVTPAYRGRDRGTAAALTTAAVGWARAEVRPDRLRLFVLDLNDRAKAFYRRSGFIESGVTMTYPPDPAYTELEMVHQTRQDGGTD